MSQCHQTESPALTSSIDRKGLEQHGVPLPARELP